MILKNLIEVVQNSSGSRMFRSYYVEEKDVLADGDLSCAFYVSTVLVMFKLIDRVHFTVNGTILAMENRGWYEIKKPRKGCVVVWNPVVQNGESHLHIGFSIGDGQAVSNRSSLKAVGEHSIHYSGLDLEQKEKIVSIHSLYWHSSLDSDILSDI